MNETDFAKAAGKVTGNTFAQTSAAIRRLNDVTFRLAKLNANGWRQDKTGNLYWRLVIAVPVDTLELSDNELARSMIEAAQGILVDRLAALTPTDGLERMEVQSRPDLRTAAGRAWKREHAGATG